MANSYFQFKQFTVIQEKSAMKVGTDGVLLGALAQVENAASVLDIGTGTGLVALMLAQRSQAQITGIEINADAAHEAQFNASNSPWNNRVTMLHTELKAFYDQHKTLQFDTIVCNPPFFENSLKAPDLARTQARHTDSLTPAALFFYAAKMLSKNGTIWLITPADSFNSFFVEAQLNKLTLQQIFNIKPLPDKPAKRIVSAFGFKSTELIQTEFVIELSRHNYSNEYIALTKDFYLKF